MVQWSGTPKNIFVCKSLELSKVKLGGGGGGGGGDPPPVTRRDFPHEGVPAIRKVCPCN